MPLYIELPTSVFLEVTYTEPGLQGDRSTGGTKPATVETGATVNVPLFITTGEKIKVDTRDGRYLGRSLMAEGPKTQMPARRKARKRALDVLYEADLRDLPPSAGAGQLPATGSRSRTRITWSTRSAWSRASPRTSTGSTS